MANDYLIYKWRLWFRVIDINHRGIISKSDVKQEEETFARLSHLDDERKREFQENLDKLWNEYIFREKSGPIDEQEFVDMNIQEYKSNKEKFVDRMKKCYTTFFDIIDVNKEGSISEEEYVNAMLACGHNNVALDKKCFEVYNPVNGKVPSKVLADSWFQFTTCDDSSKKDVVKEAFEEILPKP